MHGDLAGANPQWGPELATPNSLSGYDHVALIRTRRTAGLTSATASPTIK